MLNSIINGVLGLRGIAALATIFGLPLLESAAFVGFIFPGETAAVVGGVLAYHHRINLEEAIVAVVLGAAIGDTIGYEVGRRWGRRLLEGPLSRWIKPSHVARAEALLGRRGGWAVLVGRFTAALRVVMPGIAGTARMPYRRFALFNWSGAVVWGIAYVLLGYLAGASWRSVAKTASTAGLIAVVALAVLVVAAALIIRRRHRRGALDEGLDDA